MVFISVDHVWLYPLITMHLHFVETASRALYCLDCWIHQKQTYFELGFHHTLVNPHMGRKRGSAGLQPNFEECSFIGAVGSWFAIFSKKIVVRIVFN